MLLRFVGKSKNWGYKKYYQEVYDSFSSWYFFSTVSVSFSPRSDTRKSGTKNGSSCLFFGVRSNEIFKNLYHLCLLQIRVFANEKHISCLISLLILLFFQYVTHLQIFLTSVFGKYMVLISFSKFNSIATFDYYAIPKTSLEKDRSNAIHPIRWFIPLPKLFVRIKNVIALLVLDLACYNVSMPSGLLPIHSKLIFSYLFGL